jgi:hypothetical protein
MASEQTKVQGSGGITQTQNPQQVPGEVQPISENSEVQTAFDGSNLFANPQANAIISLPNASSNTQTLLANETESTPVSGSNLQTGAVITIVTLVILVGAYIVTRRLAAD